MVGARTKATLLWGVVGALAFLVLAQSYLLLSRQRVPSAGPLGVALVVFVTASVVGWYAADALGAVTDQDSDT
jgi:hypothetical protein